MGTDDLRNFRRLIKNIKSFTAMKIMDAIINNPQESRKAWLLDLFERNEQR
jgi:hypothetical protein